MVVAAVGFVSVGAVVAAVVVAAVVAGTVATGESGMPPMTLTQRILLPEPLE